MARMIPSFVDDHTPPGERDVFNILAAGPDDWVILHSLDLAPWNRGLRTEVDFVVFVPDTGIVCIEVKSHLNIAFDGQRWYPPEIKRSPFKQAADGSYTFYRRLRDLAPRFRHVPVVHYCIFPRAAFDLNPNLSVAPFELVDSRTFKALASSADFCVDLKTRMIKSIEVNANLQRISHPLSLGDLDDLIDLCVPVQKRRPGAREEVLRREELANSILREQQKPVLRLVDLNSHLLVSGGAGTGKTLIAMEVAQKAAAKGLRVALLCYNQLVGDWMQRKISQMQPIPPNLIVGRAIRIMAEMTGVAIPEKPHPDFWEIELPQELEERLTDPDLEATSEFDFMVLDEAQDILARSRLWQCLKQFLRGGLEGGSFALFGDFEHQVLEDRQMLETALEAVENEAHPVLWNLSENCRNYKIIGETALKLGGMPSSVYTGYLRSGGGLQNYDICFYEDDEDQLAHIKQWLREFKTQGYKAAEVTLLSYCGYETSAAATLKDAGYKLQPAWQYGKGTSYASVHAFKGMENKIVILTDVTLTDHEYHRDLFYTGMTRATECIRILCDKKSEAILYSWLSGKADT